MFWPTFSGCHNLVIRGLVHGAAARSAMKKTAVTTVTIVTGGARGCQTSAESP